MYWNRPPLQAHLVLDKTQEPVEAGIADQQAQVQGLGPLAQFDFNGDGKFSFDDIAALADEIFDVSDDA